MLLFQRTFAKSWILYNNLLTARRSNLSIRFVLFVFFNFLESGEITFCYLEYNTLHNISDYHIWNQHIVKVGLDRLINYHCLAFVKFCRWIFAMTFASAASYFSRFCLTSSTGKHCHVYFLKDGYDILLQHLSNSQYIFL
jgi:hypothetical protein